MVNAGDGEPASETPHLAASPDRLTIHLLGRFQVSVGERQIDPDAWRLRKATHVVKLLALTPGHRLHRDQLIDTLWPEVDPDSALSSFHQALHAARRALEPDRAARSTESVLRLQRQVLSLESDDGVWTDVEAFQDAVQRIRHTPDLQRCLAALDVYAGDLLPEDLYESWTQNPRESLHEMYLELLLTTARLQEAGGTTSEAAETLRMLIATDPLNEAAYAALMRLHAAGGRRDQAIRLYQQLRETLREELDAEPADEVTALFERISAGDFEATPVSTTRPLSPPTSAASTEVAGGRRISLTDLARQDGLIDRLDEVETLQQAFDALMKGHGQIVLLGGEPGIGKTRLAEEFAHYASMSGATVLWARCHETEGSPAFWPWFQIVRHSLRDHYGSAEDLRADLGSGAEPIAQVVPHIRTMLPDISEPPELDADQARFRFFDSLSSFLGRLSQRMPLVLILDDLHWADNSSLTMLEFLTDEIAGHRIMLVGTYREAEAGTSLPMIRTLERVNRSSSARRLHVGGFKLVDVAQYGAFIAGRPLPDNLVTTIYQRTNGNPFFTREVVQLLAREEETEDPRQWETAVPVGVREAITLRLAQLSDEARQALTAAAVIGAEFAFDVLAGVTGTSEDDLLRLLEEAVTLDVIAEDRDAPDRFRFAHILTQQTLYDGLIAARRVRLHARVGEVLERLSVTRTDPPYAELARHFLLAAAAGEAERAAKYLRLAGEESMARLAYTEAAEQFGRAVEVIERHLPARQAELFDVLIDLARAQLASGASDDARSSRLRSVDVARDMNDPDRLAQAAVEMAGLGSDNTDWRASNEIALLEEALERLPSENAALRVQVMSSLAVALVFDKTEKESAERIRRREHLAQEAVTIARQIETPALLTEALLAAHDVLWTYEDVDQRRAIAQELLDIALETHDPRLEMHVRAQLFGEFLIKGEISEADGELDAYEALATTYHLPVNLWSATTKRAMRAFMRGDLGDAERFMERARTLGRRSTPEVSRLTYLIQLFFIRREQDRVHEVEAMLSIEAESNPTEAFWTCLLAVLHADRGDGEGAALLLDELLNVDNPIPRDSFWLASMVLIADVCTILQDARHASQVLDVLRPYEDLFVCPGNHVIFLGPVTHYLGCLSAASGRWDDAERFFERALQQERQTGDLVSQLRTRWAHAEILARRDGGATSTMHDIEQIRRDAERHGLPRIARLARETADRQRNRHPP